jgi:hypothetical protein
MYGGIDKRPRVSKKRTGFPTVTLTVYAHLMKGENQEAAYRLENTILNLVTKAEKGEAITG